MSFASGFPRSKLKPGMVIRVDCENEDERTWSQAGIVQSPNWSDYLVLDGPDGAIDWGCVQHIELVSLLPPEE